MQAEERKGAFPGKPGKQSEKARSELGDLVCVCVCRCVGCRGFSSVSVEVSLCVVLGDLTIWSGGCAR